MLWKVISKVSDWLTEIEAFKSDNIFISKCISSLSFQDWENIYSLYDHRKSAQNTKVSLSIKILSGDRMGKKLFFELIWRVPGKIHLLPGLWQKKIKSGINESLKGRGRASRSIILMFVPKVFGNSDLIFRKS